MYSAAQKSDLGTNLIYGRYNTSNLAKLYDKVIATKTKAVIDFKAYLPDNNTPAFFVGLPVFRSDNKLTAVLAVRLSTNKINEIMRGNFGISRTGEMYLVGSDNLMRSTSLHNPINYSVKASFAGTPEKNGIITKPLMKHLPEQQEQSLSPAIPAIL